MVDIPGTGVHLEMPPAPWPIGWRPPVGPDAPGTPLQSGHTYRDDYPSPPWAPAGDRYVFTVGQLLDRALQYATGDLLHSRAELRQLLQLYSPDVGDLENVALEDGSRSLSAALQAVPATMEVPRMTFSYLVAQIHGKLGPFEEVSHSLALVHSGTAAQPDLETPENLTAVATGIMNSWTTFITGSTPGGLTVANYLSSDLSYDYVKVAMKHQSGPLAKGASAKGLVRNVGEPVEVAFGAGVRGQTDAGLPNQIALVLSLGTQRKGGSYRGRMYLGGLAASILDSSSGHRGMFNTGLTGGIGSAFGTTVIAGLATGLYHANVWSTRLNAGREIASVSVGAVPDTMRSRRKSLKENPQLAWGTL